MVLSGLFRYEQVAWVDFGTSIRPLAQGRRVGALAWCGDHGGALIGCESMVVA